MANNIDILGEDAALVQHLLDDYSATQGHFEDDKITRVRSYTFLGRKTLKSIRLQNVTSLGVQAITNCQNLETIDLPALEYIKQVVFSGNTALKNVNMPNVKGTTYNPTSVFANDTSLPSIAFPSYNSLFTAKFMQNCTALQTFDGGRCTGIAGEAFNGCTSLISVILRNSNAAVTLSNLNAFSGTKYATSGAGGAYIYVPRDLIPSYQAATNWATLYAAHSDMFRSLEDYTVDGTTTGEFRSFDTGYRWDGTTGEIPVKVADENWMCTSIDWSVTGLYADPNKIRNTSGVRILKNTLNEDGTLHGVWGGVDSNGSASVIPGGHAWKSDNRIHFLLNVPINATDPVNNIIVTT